MILTITLNPSIDICYYMDSYSINDINRCRNYVKTAGGKGINVSKVLRNLGNKVIATGFLGGATGQLIEEQLSDFKIVSEFVKIDGDTRNCIAIIAGEEQTEILESGPIITEKDSENLKRLIIDILKNNHINVISASGSLPEGLRDDFYIDLIEIAKEENLKFVLDTSAKYLKNAIKVAPFLIKPNISELENLLGTNINSEDQLIETLYHLRKYNVEMIVVSLGKEGSIALCGNDIYKVTIPTVDIMSPVGSGDALVAGMVSEIDKGSSYEEILRVGNTCGVLNAMNRKTGHIDMDDFGEVYGKVKVKMIR